MKNRMLIWIAWMIPIAMAVHAADPVDLEMSSLIERAKSPQLPKRQEAVRELLALREAVSDELTSIILAANLGQVDAGAKESALYLIGELGLLQCKDLVEKERNWKWRPTNEGRIVVVIEDREADRVFNPAGSALNRACFVPSVRLVDPRPEGSVSEYTSLARAFVELRSPSRQVRRAAEKVVLRWQEVVCAGMNSVLESSKAHVYSDGVKVAAAYLLGEYRSRSSYRLLLNIDLKDENGDCATYARSLAVETSDGAYPCAVALIKMGYRANIHGCLGRIQTKPDLAQETRNRIARVLMKIDAAKAREIYDTTVAALEKGERWAGPPEQKESRLQSLRSVEPIFKRDDAPQ